MKKVLSVILALVMCFGALSMFASAAEPQATAPDASAKVVDVRIKKVPLWNRIVFGTSAHGHIDGIVMEFEYSDGSVREGTIIKTEIGFRVNGYSIEEVGNDSDVKFGIVSHSFYFLENRNMKFSYTAIVIPPLSVLFG